MDVPLCNIPSSLRHHAKLFCDTIWLGWDRKGNSEACDIEMNPRETECRPPTKTIEDYRAGYPRFCAYVAANPDFLVCRRFLRLRSRLLCLKQDKLSQLEEQLDNLDQNEASPLFLGMSRCDRNTARTSLLSQASVLLDDYDSFLEKTHRILGYVHALPRDVTSLRNWMMNGSLNKDERRYLDQQQDLISLGSSSDAAKKNLENWVEDLLVDNWKGFRSIPGHETSNDPSVYLYSGSLIRRITDVLMLSLIALLLLCPVIICVLITSTWARIAVITLATLIYLSILSRLTKAKMIELVLAGSTFATILNVFVTGVNSN